ncbi:MAG TPA: metallophosphoesterase, partial [Thermoanaerobaculia bacterium]|nr:metallophosphoesterase [Thermoanaerobaculia bacterium]
MATYAIGDIHGSYETLRRLLTRIEYDPACDRLWLVGDLVNRGPRSLAVLRWAISQGDRVVAVLGNH